jgi:Coenzyme PQQ synthesis protein D (PqqD)
VLLAPERVFKADAIAAEIIKRCTGEVTFSELIDDLAKAYTARFGGQKTLGIVMKDRHNRAGPG